ncbi:transposase [Escherichia coli]
MLRMECNRRENADIDAQESVERMINHLKMELESVRRAIKEHISNVPELKKQNDLLLSIPGIGTVSASLILSFMASKEFTKAKEVTAFLGLNPRHHQSGTSVRVKWHTEFGHLNRGDMLTSEQHRCSNEKKKFQRRV